MKAINKTTTNKHRLIIVKSSIQLEVIAHLSKQADIAYQLRQLDRVEAISKHLTEIHAPIGAYYNGLASQRFGQGDLDHARSQLEFAAQYAPRDYRARAFLILGSVAEYRQNYRSELEYYRYALEANQNDIFTAVETRRAIAIRYFAEGERDRAIKLLESLTPLAAHNQFLNATLLNHLAVYYHDAGQLQKAWVLSQLACASPLVIAHAEWTETRDDIAADLAEQEARAIIVAAPKQNREEKQPEDSTSNHFHIRSRIDHFDLTIAPIIIDPPITHLIQSRLMHSTNPHALPFTAGN